MQDKDKLVSLQSLKTVYDKIQQQQDVQNASLSNLNNTTQSPADAGLVWTSTDDGAQWSQPNGGGDIVQNPSITTGGMVVDSTLADIDKTLTMDNYAADSKATGDKIRSIQGNVASLGTAIAAVNSAKQDKLIAGENISIVGNVISATGGSAEREWVLKGALTCDADDRGNIDTGLNIDLTGCTQLFFDGYTVASATSNLRFISNGNNTPSNAFSSVSMNGSRHVMARFANSPIYVQCIHGGASNNKTSREIPSSGSGYSLYDISAISNITLIVISTPSVITECEIKFYAR